MSDPKQVIYFFELNQRIIRLQTEGITHLESLIQPPFRGNCLNWVTGHLIENRNNILDVVGLDKIWGTEKIDLYKRGSEPVTSDSSCINFEELLNDLEKTLEILIPHLKSLPNDFYNRENKPEDVRNARLDKLTFFLWHEIYHIGQMELLRQLTGKDDSIIP